MDNFHYWLTLISLISLLGTFLVDFSDNLSNSTYIALLQSLDLVRSKTPSRRSPPEDRTVPRPPSAPVHHERIPHTPHLSPKKEAFNNLLNKGITGKYSLVFLNIFLSVFTTFCRIRKFLYLIFLYERNAFIII